MKDKPDRASARSDLSLLAERFLAFFAYELEDQQRFNQWIEDIMTNREHNPGALTLLNLLLNKALPTPQAMKVSTGEEGFTLRVVYSADVTPPAGVSAGFALVIPPGKEAI